VRRGRLARAVDPQGVGPQRVDQVDEDVGASRLALGGGHDVDRRRFHPDRVGGRRGEGGAALDLEQQAGGPLVGDADGERAPARGRGGSVPELLAGMVPGFQSDAQLQAVARR
jgi:hypothetical protein